MILKLNPDFIPLELNDNDELFNNGVFQFNITEMIKYIKDKPEDVELISIMTDDFPSFGELDQNYVDSVDYTRPGIIAEISPERYNEHNRSPKRSNSKSS